MCFEVGGVRATSALWEWEWEQHNRAERYSTCACTSLLFHVPLPPSLPPFTIYLPPAPCHPSIPSTIAQLPQTPISLASGRCGVLGEGGGLVVF